MKNTQLPTLEQIEKLTAFLPQLYAEGFVPVVRWQGSEKRKDGSFSMPYPAYDRLVEEFFRLVSSDGWLDTEYDTEQAYRMIQDEARVRSASLPEIRVMLTFCTRGERFSDGHWGEMIEKGHIRRLLERLNEIKSQYVK